MRVVVSASIGLALIVVGMVANPDGRNTEGLHVLIRYPEAERPVIVPQVEATEPPVTVAQAEAEATVAQAERVEQSLTLRAQNTGADAVPVASQTPWREQYRAAIEAVFPPQEWGNALAIVGCETGETYAPHAVGDQGRAVGGFQVWSIFHGVVPEDIVGQVRQAFGIWQRSGWQPWTCRSVLR